MLRKLSCHKADSGQRRERVDSRPYRFCRQSAPSSEQWFNVERQRVDCRPPSADNLNLAAAIVTSACLRPARVNGGDSKLKSFMLVPSDDSSFRFTCVLHHSWVLSNRVVPRRRGCPVSAVRRPAGPGFSLVRRCANSKTGEPRSRAGMQSYRVEAGKLVETWLALQPLGSAWPDAVAQEHWTSRPPIK